MADAGALSGLPGEGKPLSPDGGDQAGDRWAAFHVMRNEQVLPPWAELRREIDAEVARLVIRARRHLAWMGERESLLAALPAERILEARRASREGDRTVRAEIGAAVRELNRLVARFDLLAPVPMLQMLPLTAEGIFAEAGGPRGRR